MKRKMFCVLFLLIGCAMMLFASGAKEATTSESSLYKMPTEYISIGGNQVGQTTYTWASGIADLIIKNSTSKAAAEETKGVNDNINMLISGDIELGFMTSAIVKDAYYAVGAYEKITPNKIMTVMGIAPCETHIIVAADSDIKSIWDFKGKRIGMGQPGSAVITLAKNLISYIGLSEGDFKEFDVNLQTQCDMMKDGQLDVLIWNGTASLPAIAELCLSMKVRFIEIEESDLKAICDIFTYAEVTIPADTYKGQEKDIKTFQTRNTLATCADVPEETIYAITKMIFENVDVLKTVHAGFGGITKEGVLLGQAVECVHPGALKYYREIGIIK